MIASIIELITTLCVANDSSFLFFNWGGGLVKAKVIEEIVFFAWLCYGFC